METRFPTPLRFVTAIVCDGATKPVARTQTGVIVFGDMPGDAISPALAARRAP
jgi:hypothetical protein